MRKEFTMTEADLAKIIEACKPVPYMVIGGIEPQSTQQNADNAWRELGDRMGFDGMTAKPVEGLCNLHFTAEEKEIATP